MADPGVKATVKTLWDEMREIHKNEIPRECTTPVITAQLGDTLPVEAFGTQKMLKLGTRDLNGNTIEFMALHPAGLFVLRNGRKLILSSSKYNYVELAPGA